MSVVENADELLKMKILELAKSSDEEKRKIVNLEKKIRNVEEEKRQLKEDKRQLEVEKRELEERLYPSGKMPRLQGLEPVACRFLDIALEAQIGEKCFRVSYSSI